MNFNTVTRDKNELTIDERIEYLNRLSQYEYDSIQVVTEGFVQNAIIAILDTIIAVVNNLKTTTFKSFRMLKRSELRAFIESNRIKVITIEKKPFSEVKDIKVPVPYKFKSTYLETTNALNELFMFIKMQIFLNELKKQIGNINVALLEKEKVSENITTAAKVVEAKLNGSSKLVKKIDSSFSGDKIGEESFSKVFENMKSFSTVKDILLSLESEQIGISKVETSINDVEKAFELIINKIMNENIELTRKDIGLLAAFARDIARMFTTYGTSAQDLLTIEHNYVEVLKVLKDKLD